MTKQDLTLAGVLDDQNVSNLETALLFLNYNEKLTKNKELFFHLKQNLFNKFNNLEGLSDDESENLLSYAVAIVEKPLQDIFSKNKSNSDRVLQAHNLCVDLTSIENYSKEHINQARTLAELCDTMKIRGRKYSQEKGQYNFIKQCVYDEGVFTSFYSRVEGRVNQKQAKNMVSSKLAEIEKDFLKKQEKYLNFFVNFQLREDVRLIKAQNMI